MISAETLQTIAGVVQEEGGSDETVTQLRSRLGISLTLCSDDDVIAATPAFEGQGFNLYLVDGSGHCWCLTTDATRATGVLVATCDE